MSGYKIDRPWVIVVYNTSVTLTFEKKGALDHILYLVLIEWDVNMEAAVIADIE